MTQAHKWNAWVRDLEPKPNKALHNRFCLDVLTRNAIAAAAEPYDGIRWIFEDGSELSITPTTYWVHA